MNHKQMLHGLTLIDFCVCIMFVYTVHGLNMSYLIILFSFAGLVKSLWSFTHPCFCLISWSFSVYFLLVFLPYCRYLVFKCLLPIILDFVCPLYWYTLKHGFSVWQWFITFISLSFFFFSHESWLML